MNNNLEKILSTNNWQKVNTTLLAKILREFLYEDLIKTEVNYIDNNRYQHTLNITSNITYKFIAEPRIFGNWYIDENSIEYTKDNNKISKLSVHEFICNTYKESAINEITLGHFLREINHTLIADCHILEKPDNINETLLGLPYSSQLEGYMYGHPWFVINKGRLGFSYHEYLDYAPENQNQQNLAWIAVDKASTNFNSISTLDYAKIINQELSTTDLEKFKYLLSKKKLNIDDYYLMPIHPWQWQRQLIQLFTTEIVQQKIIYLGYSSDYYLATQSIRSFNNQTNIKKYQVKLPLSIFNTAVYRGLPSERTILAPVFSEWIKQVQHNDDFLKSKNTIMLGEIASINYSHPIYNNLSGVPYQYQELLGVIWRENINNYLQPNEKVITMAALIHRDKNEEPLVNLLISKSKLTIDNWLKEFFEVSIPPLLHWLYKYGVVYSPHGENTMLVLDDNFKPTRLVLKDFIDDVNITDKQIPELNTLPPSLKEILYKLPEHELTQFIHTGLFVVLYRYLSDILQTYTNFSEYKFWLLVQKTIEKYHNEHPELKERIDSFNIFKPSFKKLTLNRLRLIDVGYGDYANRPKVESTSFVNNPINHEFLQNWHNKYGDVK